MKIQIALALLAAGLIRANTYPLQFGPSTTTSGVSALYVAGYKVDPVNGVSGECNYVSTTHGSGRGAKTFHHYFKGVCTWDLFGRVTSSSHVEVAGTPVPTPPPPVSVNGTIITYGTDAAGDRTGQTTLTSGFVYHASPDYSWAAANSLSATNLSPATFQATLTSTGDLPLTVSGANVSSSLAAGGTAIKVKVTGNTCAGQTVPNGSICTISGTYDATVLTADDPITVYDTLLINVITNSGNSHQLSLRVYVAVTPE
jgi:hypothetical protein